MQQRRRHRAVCTQTCKHSERKNVAATIATRAGEQLRCRKFCVRRHYRHHRAIRRSSFVRELAAAAAVARWRRCDAKLETSELPGAARIDDDR